MRLHRPTVLLLLTMAVPVGVVRAQRPGTATVRCAPPDAEQLAAVRRVLRGYEQVPRAAWWRAQSRCTSAVLQVLAATSSERPMVRLRALWALRHYPGSEAARWLRRQVAARRLPTAELRVAIGSLAVLEKEAALPLLRPLLDDRRAPVRLAAARALLRVGDPQARRWVEQAEAREARPAVARRMRRLLRGR